MKTVSCRFQKENFVCEQNEKNEKRVSEHRAMEQDAGFGLWVWGVAEVVNVTIWTKTTDDGETR